MTPRVVIVGYDPAWPAMYEEEKALILGAIGPWVKGIEHVGSTSVPGLAAKPIIDIMVGVWNLDDAAYCIGRLVTVGYDFKPDDDIPERRYFNKGPQARHRHLHMTELGGDFWLRHLLFRDYLRAHAETARQYQALKRELAQLQANRAALTSPPRLESLNQQLNLRMSPLRPAAEGERKETVALEKSSR